MKGFLLSLGWKACLGLVNEKFLVCSVFENISQPWFCLFVEIKCSVKARVFFNLAISYGDPSALLLLAAL